MESLVKREIIESFNDKPKDGINKIKKWCDDNNKDFAEETAKFFYEEKKNLNLEFVGDYLGTGDNEKVLAHFVKQFDFKEKDYLESLREFLGSFRLPGEGQKVGRLVESFGSRYYEQNTNNNINHEDAALILAFATVGLNTNLHNPSMKDKWTIEQFKDQLKGLNTESKLQKVDSGKNFNDEFLRKIYDGIKANPFKLNFIESAAGYEIAGINSQSDKTFKKLDDFLTTKTGINNVFHNLANSATVEHKQPKTWLNKFTGYEGSVLIKDGNAEVEIQVYKPNILSKWFLGEKNKLVIQPKQQSEQSLKLAAQIAASFETEVTSIKATYDYLTEDLINQYENAKKPELAQAASAIKLQENIQEITKDLQKQDPQIPDIRQKPLDSEKSFKDLTEADLGKTLPSKPLSFDEELKERVLNKKTLDILEEPVIEEKIDNHAKRLEELKQNQQELENRKNELEKKANSNITKEERWKITGELEGISNQLKAVEKERNTISTVTERTKQFDNNNKLAQNKKEPTAAELQQQGAMEAIKRIKEEKRQQEEAASKAVSSSNPVAQSLKPGVIPPPMPSSKIPILSSSTMPTANKINIPPEAQEKLKTITKQIPQEKNKHQKELIKAIEKRNKNLHSRG